MARRGSSAYGRFDGISFFGAGPATSAYINHWIELLQNEEMRELALAILVQEKDQVSQFGRIVCHSRFTISILILEIVSVYRVLATPYITARLIDRACNAIVLLQTAAANQEVRMELVKQKIPDYLYPIMATLSGDILHERLRFHCISFFRTLVSATDERLIGSLLRTKVVHHTLICLENGKVPTKEVAAEVLHSVLVHEGGLRYCCALIDRFVAISRVLGGTVAGFGLYPSPILVRYIVGCYHRLSNNFRACAGLRGRIDELVGNLYLLRIIETDQLALTWLAKLVDNLDMKHPLVDMMYGPPYRGAIGQRRR